MKFTGINYLSYGKILCLSLSVLYQFLIYALLALSCKVLLIESLLSHHIVDCSLYIIMLTENVPWHIISISISVDESFYSHILR